MVAALATGGLWRLVWISLIGAVVVAALSSALRLAGVSWRRIRWTLLGLYGVGYVAWFFVNGIIIDRISVLYSFAVFLALGSVGKPLRQWTRTGFDLTLFVAMWIAYDESRGVADRIGMPVQVESVRDLDRALMFGTDGVVWLQDRFLSAPGTVRWYDVVASCVYYSHFVVPPLVMAILWYRNRDDWLRYMRRFATVMFVACAMFVLLPTAPPWMAAGGRNAAGYEFEALPPLRRPTGNGWRHIGLEGFVEAWDVGRDWANQVAAMPSLHSAYALFVVVFFWNRVRDVPLRWPGSSADSGVVVPASWIRVTLLLYPATMAVALMYFAEHYLTDAIAGWLVVGASFWMWDRIEGRWAARRAIGADTGEHGVRSRAPTDHEAAPADTAEPIVTG